MERCQSEPLRLMSEMVALAAVNVREPTAEGK